VTTSEGTETAPGWGSRILHWPVALARKLVQVIPDAGQRYFADHCALQAAGIAYRVLFSVAPLAIVLVSIFGLVLQNDSVRHDVVHTIVDALPVSDEGTQKVEDALTAMATPASAIGLISLLVFVWAAMGMMTALRQGLESAMHVTESRPSARGKLVDLALVVGATVLVLIVAGLTVLGDAIQGALRKLADLIGLGVGTVADSVSHFTVFLLSIVVVMLVYRFVPARGLRIRDSLAGAIVTSALFQAISLASTWIYDKTTKLSVIYGSLTVALVFLYSVYLVSSALLLGAEIAAAWSQPRSDEGEPVLVQIKRGIFGLFVKQEAPASQQAGARSLSDDEGAPR